MAAQGVWQSLLPGIPNDVTLPHIATKLSWTSFNVLSSLSQSWHGAIQRHEIHRERVRSQTAETLVVVKHREVIEHRTSRVPNSISLYSMREKIFYALPPIPHRRGISRYFQFASVSGKLYVVGGDRRCQCHICSDGRWEENQQQMCTANLDTQMYVLELAGQGQWEERTGIQEPDATNFGFAQDSNTKPWTSSTACPELARGVQAAFGSGDPELKVILRFILPVNNELLALASCYRGNDKYGDIVLHRRGFGTETEEIVWEKASRYIRPELHSSLNICLIQL